MWLLLWLLLLYVLLVHGLNIYVSGAVSLIYLLWYLDGREYTGERHWPGFRRLFLWRYSSPVQYTIANEVDLEQQLGPKQQRLYVLLPGNTYFAVLWGIGLHGGRLPPKMSERLHWVVPPLLMAIPILRDVLLWSGAVTYHERKHPLADVLLGLLNANRSVCYCPAQYANTISGSGATTAGLSEQMLAFAREHHTQLVPILVTGERPTITRVQRWMFTTIGYPFPMLVFARYWSRTRPPPLMLQFGPIMRCGDYEDAALLRESFNTNVYNMACVDMGDEELEIV